MQLPDDFGLGPIATLAHVGHTQASWRHAAFWGAWEKAFSPEAPCIRELAASAADTTDPTATHQFESVRSMSIGAVLVEPPTGVRLRAGVVAVHGYTNVGPLAGDRERWEYLASRGVACLSIRLRGFPGSARDGGLFTDHPAGWICQGLSELVAAEDAPPSVQVATWIVPQAVADIVNAARALSRWMSGAAPVYLFGESLGAGLAVIAAARGRRLVKIERLALELPSMGDWRWRLDRDRENAQGWERTPNSAGFHVRTLLRQHQQNADRFMDALRICDAVVHAPEVTVPAVCKLAERDEVVPAPCAAAVYNALGTDPDLRWRFVVPYGHFDGGLRNARRHALFERAVDLFLDPQRTPHDAAELVEPILVTGERLPESAGSALGSQVRRAEAPSETSLFGASETPARPPRGEPGADPAQGKEIHGEVSLERLLCDAYRSGGRTLDDLPYTQEFAALAGAVRARHASMTDREIFHKLHNTRKAGRLPKLGRSPASKPAVPLEDERLLIQLVEHAVGSTGQRDQLPYTDAFDRVVWDFNQRTGRSLHAHEVWRLVATLSK